MIKHEYKKILDEIKMLKEAILKRDFELFIHAEQVSFGVHTLTFKKGDLEVNLEIGDKKAREELFNEEFNLHRHSKLSAKLMDVKMHYKKVE